MLIMNESGELFQFDFSKGNDWVLVNGDKNYIGIYNSSIGEIQFIDGKYRMSKLKYRGSDKVCIDDINNDGLEEMVTLVDGRLLVCCHLTF